MGVGIPVGEGAAGGGAWTADADKAEVAEVVQVQDDGILFIFPKGHAAGGGDGTALVAAELFEAVGLDKVVVEAAAEEPEAAGFGLSVGAANEAEVFAVFVEGIGGVVKGGEGGGGHEVKDQDQGQSGGDRGWGTVWMVGCHMP